jgi:hypothetical protein
MGVESILAAFMQQAELCIEACREDAPFCRRQGRGRHLRDIHARQYGCQPDGANGPVGDAASPVKAHHLAAMMTVVRVGMPAS